MRRVEVMAPGTHTGCFCCFAAEFSHQKPASGGTSRDVFRVHGRGKHYTSRVDAGIGE
jgi:hypothetical protein